MLIIFSFKGNQCPQMHNHKSVSNSSTIVDFLAQSVILWHGPVIINWQVEYPILLKLHHANFYGDLKVIKLFSPSDWAGSDESVRRDYLLVLFVRKKWLYISTTITIQQSTRGFVLTFDNSLHSRRPDIKDIVIQMNYTLQI